MWLTEQGAALSEGLPAPGSADDAPAPAWASRRAPLPPLLRWTARGCGDGEGSGLTLLLKLFTPWGSGRLQQRAQGKGRQAQQRGSPLVAHHPAKERGSALPKAKTLFPLPPGGEAAPQGYGQLGRVSLSGTQRCPSSSPPSPPYRSSEGVPGARARPRGSGAAAVPGAGQSPPGAAAQAQLVEIPAWEMR